VSSAPSPRQDLSEEKLARAALTYLAEPGDPALGALLAICSPAEVLAAIKADMLPGTGPGCGDTPASRAALDRALGRWRARLPTLPHEEHLADTSRDGIRLSCPGDADWPGALDQLGHARPYALWLRGHTDLRFACSRSVSMVGSRAATSYGGHADLFAAIAGQGLVISEWPPGRHPARTRFLVRNRVIAALGCGTVIVEAGERSGALNTARHAATLGKPLMAVPGPVTSVQSAGCHRIIREWGASCVTRAADIIELLSPLSVPDALAPGGVPDALAPGVGQVRLAPGGGPGQRSRPGLDADRTPSRDGLDPDSARVLDALPTRGGAGTSTIAVEAGVDLDTVLRCLGRLAGYGFIERCDRGWRLRRS
jgi:DNA processing protein